MIFLKDFVLKKTNLKLQKRLGEDGIMDSLIMPLFDFFSNKTFEKIQDFIMNLLNGFFPQISKFENSKKARRR